MKMSLIKDDHARDSIMSKHVTEEKILHIDRVAGCAHVCVDMNGLVIQTMYPSEPVLHWWRRGNKSDIVGSFGQLVRNWHDCHFTFDESESISLSIMGGVVRRIDV